MYYQSLFNDSLLPFPRVPVRRPRQRKGYYYGGENAPVRQQIYRTRLMNSGHKRRRRILLFLDFRHTRVPGMRDRHSMHTRRRHRRVEGVRRRVLHAAARRAEAGRRRVCGGVPLAGVVIPARGRRRERRRVRGVVQPLRRPRRRRGDGHMRHLGLVRLRVRRGRCVRAALA
jgi:hypothetical protein